MHTGLAQLTYAAGNGSPLVFHIVNLVLHALVITLVIFVLFELIPQGVQDLDIGRLPVRTGAELSRYSRVSPICGMKGDRCMGTPSDRRNVNPVSPPPWARMS